MKIVFIGTSEFGIPTLEKLTKESAFAKASDFAKATSDKSADKYELVLIITQPDKPTGRKQTLTPPPIKLWSQKNNIKVIQPEKIADAADEIKSIEPDLSIVAAYGQIIPKNILDIPKFKSINIHGSLLPKYRGASPIQSAILSRDSETGITLIQMDEKMDHGPVLAKEVLRLKGDETFSYLYKKLAELSAELVVKTLPDYFNGKLKAVEQNHQYATFAKLIKRADSKIDWSSSAVQIDALIRALNPEPGTWTMLDGKVIKILKAKILKDHKIELPGKIYPDQGMLAVKTIDNSLVIEEIQPEGKAPMSGKDFLNGLRKGSRLFM